MAHREVERVAHTEIERVAHREVDSDVVLLEMSTCQRKVSVTSVK